jgi:hypothetical protein
MKSILAIALAVAVPASALAGSDKTQAAGSRDVCVARQGQMVITRTAQWTKQGYSKLHTFEVSCEAYLSKKESLKSWYTIDSKQAGQAQISWEPTSKNDILKVKCRTNDPLIAGKGDYNYQDVQSPTDYVEFERIVSLEDGGPAQLSRLGAFAQQSVSIDGKDSMLDFITIQGNKVGNKFYLELVAYPSELTADSQAPHYTKGVSPRVAAEIPLDTVALKGGCADLPQMQTQGKWGSSGTLETYVD